MRTESSIKTYIRMRPPATDTIFPHDDHTLACADRLYTFNHVFPPDASDQHIFERIGFQLVENTLSGLNSTLFAYGQTGTGKTYTMTGNSSKEGLVQRSVALLLRKLKNSTHFAFYSLKMNYIEIYNETIRDLLAEKDNKIIIRELAKSGFYVEGLESVELTDEEGFGRELRRGLLKRSTKSTKMNEVSSRSHTILTVFLEVKMEQDDKGCLMRDSKLNFVDLAGSEKQKQTDVSGSKLKEASSINKSLTTLSLVISKLAEKQAKASHIPYRESILTKLLKDSIGGNSMTTFIGMISAQKTWLSETISTLLFLDRLKSVKNIVQINEKIDGKEEELVKKIKTQQDKIAQLEQKLIDMTQEYQNCKEKLEQSQIQVKELEERLLYQGGLSSFFPPFDQQQDPHLESQSYYQSPDQTQQDCSSSREAKLSVIQQQRSESEENKDKSHFQTEVKQRPRPPSSNKGSLKSIKQQSKMLLEMQNQFLRAEIKKYQEEDEAYGNFIKMITENMNNFQFATAQILIMQAQAEKLKRTEAHLQAYRRKFSELAAASEMKQAQMETQLMQVRSLELDNISQKSIYLSNENKLRQELQQLKAKEAETDHRFATQEENYKIQLFKLQENNLILQEAQNKAQDQLRFLNDEAKRLNQIIALYETDPHIASSCDAEKSVSESTGEEEVEEENKRLREKVQELEDIIEKDFMVSMEELQGELREKNELNYNLINQNCSLREAVAAAEAQLLLYQQKCSENEAEISNLMLINAQTTQEQTYYLDNIPITFQELLIKYQHQSCLLEENQRTIQTLKSEVAAKQEALKAQEQRLMNQREAHRQAQTYFRYQLKARGAQVSKLKLEQSKLSEEKQVRQKQHEESQMRIAELQHEVCDLSAQLASKQDIQSSLSAELADLRQEVQQQEERRERELKQTEQIHLQVQQLRLLAERAVQSAGSLREEKQELQRRLQREQCSFAECLKSLSKANQLYRSQECCFYRSRDELRQQLEALRQENLRLQGRV